MKFQDYYETLGVARSATQDEIKRAYRKLARKYHPDVSKDADAEVRFKELGEAYAVLKDPEKRAAYDQVGQNWKAGQDFQPPPGWDAGFEFRGDGAGDGQDASDFFEALFGRHARAEQRARGPYQGHERAHARGQGRVSLRRGPGQHRLPQSPDQRLRQLSGSHDPGSWQRRKLERGVLRLPARTAAQILGRCFRTGSGPNEGRSRIFGALPGRTARKDPL